MRLSERVVVERLFQEARKRGFSCTSVEAVGCEEALRGAPTISYDACIAFAKEIDADTRLIFRRDKEWFWVLLVWGNGEDVISDYSAVRYADQVIDPVYAWINDAEEVR